MSRYVMKQDWFCIGTDYTVKDAANDPVLRIDGKVFCIGDQLEIKTMDGRRLAYVDQKMFSWGPTYEIWRAGHLAAVVRKSLFTLLHCKFTVDVPGPDDLVATGDFWDKEYEFSRQGRRVATVSRKFLAFNDTYGIEVPHGEDPILVIASAVVIDLCCHGDRK
ncbi:MAG TPA: LURP-one-related family protein [Planctomycetota bacterium]|nr:LURP-one-related family protein [Planctomycetota bacterium]